MVQFGEVLTRQDVEGYEDPIRQDIVYAQVQAERDTLNVEYWQRHIAQQKAKLGHVVGQLTLSFEEE